MFSLFSIICGSKPEMELEDLTDEMVRSIGQQHIQNQSSSGDQVAASTLANFNQQSTALERWNILLIAYSQLEAPSGYIADKIEKLVKKVCGKLPTKYYCTQGMSFRHSVVIERVNTLQYTTKLAHELAKRVTSQTISSEYFVGSGYRMSQGN